MSVFKSTRVSGWVIAAIVAVAAGLAAFDAAIAQDSGAAERKPGGFVVPGARLELKPDTLDFGKVIVTLTSAPLTVTATNKSKSASIDFTSIVASSPFSIQSDGCSGAPLAAGSSCKVEVVYHPEAAGKVKDKDGLTFTDSAKRSPQHVELEGQGIIRPTPTPTITVSPTPSLIPTPPPSPTPTPGGPTPTMTPTPSPGGTPTMTATRTVTPTCTPLPTPYIAGLVLIAGGQGSDGSPLNTAEVFNPGTNSFTLTTAPALGGSNMTDARYSHASAAVSYTSAFGTVAVTGGIDASGATSSTETFSTLTNQFTAGGAMSDSRQGHTATFLVMPTGELLVAGGQDASGTVLKSAEIYCFASGCYGVSPMNTARVNAAASGEQFYTHIGCPAAPPALIAGGFDGTNVLQSAEVFDSGKGTFTLTDQLGGSPMNAPRDFHTATLCAAGILIAGGQGATGVAQSTAEVFVAASNTFTLTTELGGTNMTVARAKHTATGIGPYYPDQVLIAGGIDSSGNALASAEVFDSATYSFTAVGPMHSARYDHATALLANGKVLITGGEDGSGNTLNTAEIYNPATQTFTLTTDPSLGGTTMNVARKLHTATAY
jgi:hypothetical protein